MGEQEMKYYSTYARLGRRWWRRPAARGFRLSPTRVSVRRLRARLWTLHGLLGRYVRNVRLLKTGLGVSRSGGGSTSPSTRGSGRRVLAVLGGKDGGATAAGRRAQAATLLGLLGRCVRNVRLLARGFVVSSSGGGGSTSPSTRGSGRRVLSALGGPAAEGKAPAAGGNVGTGGGNKPARRPPCMRSNSFYERAVAECLEFIKGSNAGGATPAVEYFSSHQTIQERERISWRRDSFSF